MFLSERKTKTKIITSNESFIRLLIKQSSYKLIATKFVCPSFRSFPFSLKIPTATQKKKNFWYAIYCISWYLRQCSFLFRHLACDSCKRHNFFAFLCPDKVALLPLTMKITKIFRFCIAPSCQRKYTHKIMKIRNVDLHILAYLILVSFHLGRGMNVSEWEIAGAKEHIKSHKFQKI